LAVQVVEAPEFTVEGEQVNEDNAAGASRVKAADFVMPFSRAFTCVVASAEMAATVAVKTALVRPTGTETDAGTVTLELVLLKVTVVPPLGAARVRLTVQAEVPGAVTEMGAQFRVLNCAGGRTVTVAVWLIPPADAVITMEVVAVTELAEAGSEALVAPAGTVTEVGTVSAVPFALTVITIPPAGAALVRLTVQVVEVPESTVEGEQATEDRTAGAIRVRAADLELPFNEALTCAVASVLMAATLAVKLPLV
jgi:hypothetical protein